MENFESYIAEYLIIRWTETFKMEKPSYKFWTVGNKYHEMFIRNMKAAIGLKKKFQEKTIIGAIKSDYFKNIYHIGLKAYGPRGWKYNQVALEAIKSYHKEEKRLAKTIKEAKKAEDFSPPEEQSPKENTVRRKSSAPKKEKSIFNKLRNI